MIYGLYLSATGVMTNAYRQDVIANNIANSETVGFKKDLALFDQRLTEAQQRRLAASGPLSPSNALLEKLGGGLLVHPTTIDTAQGELEPTGSPLDVAIEGDGYFAVNSGGQTRLTRNGQFAVDSTGHLILSNARGEQDLTPAMTATLHNESVERANLDPATELAALMDTQRQLEANANMIRYQDQTLSKLVNEVGKIG